MPTIATFASCRCRCCRSPCSARARRPTRTITPALANQEQCCDKLADANAQAGLPGRHPAHAGRVVDHQPGNIPVRRETFHLRSGNRPRDARLRPAAARLPERPGIDPAGPQRDARAGEVTARVSLGRCTAAELRFARRLRPDDFPSRHRRRPTLRMRPWRTASAAGPPSTSGNASSRSTSSPRWTRPGWRRDGCRSRCASCSRTCCATRTASRSRKRTSARWPAGTRRPRPRSEIAFMPARVLLQDFTGVPAVVDLAAMRDAMKALGGDPTRINPLLPAELVIDHSVQVDEFGKPRGAVAERADRVRAQPGALRVPALGADGVPQLRGGAARHRHRPPGEPGVPGARGVHGRIRRPARRRPTPTRWSAPTRTRRWSTAWACWAGASAASRPRRRCSASRCRC